MWADDIGWFGIFVLVGVALAALATGFFKARKRRQDREEARWRPHWDMLFGIIRQDTSSKLQMLSALTQDFAPGTTTNGRYQRIRRAAGADTSAKIIQERNEETLEQLGVLNNIALPELSHVVMAYQQQCLRLRAAMKSGKSPHWGLQITSVRETERLVVAVADKLGIRHQERDEGFWEDVDKALERLREDEQKDADEWGAEQQEDVERDDR